MRYYLYILVILTITSCKSQTTNQIKKDTMKIFDIETFNKNKKANSGYDGYYLKDSTYIRQFGNEYSGYVEYETPPKPQVFQIYREFYPNGKLKRIGKNFPNDFEKGVWKEYDEQGNLIKETDYDKPYKFTWEDILKYIKQRKFDMDAYGFEVGRNVVDGKPVWSIIYNKSEEDMKLGVIGLDGITGEIFQESEIDYPLEE